MQIVCNFLPASAFSECPVNMGELEKLAWSGIRQSIFLLLDANLKRCSPCSLSGVPRNYRSRVWQILCGYQPAHRGEEVVRRKREEYAGYVDQYFNNKEEDIHKDTFR